MWEEAIDNNLGIVRRIQGWGWIGWHREVIPWYFDVSRAKSWEVLFVGVDLIGGDGFNDGGKVNFWVGVGVMMESKNVGKTMKGVLDRCRLVVLHVLVDLDVENVEFLFETCLGCELCRITAPG